MAISASTEGSDQPCSQWSRRPSARYSATISDEHAQRRHEPDGDRELPPTVGLRDRGSRHFAVEQRVGNRGERERSQEERGAREPEREHEPAADGAAPAPDLGAEVERQARADEEQGGACRRPGGVVRARTRHRDMADMAQLDDAHHDEQDELDHGDHAEPARATARTGAEREQHDRDRQDQLERAPVRRDAGKTGASRS